MEADREFYELDVLGFLPVFQVLQIVYKARIFEVASLGEKVKIVRVAEALDKLQLNLKQSIHYSTMRLKLCSTVISSLPGNVFFVFLLVLCRLEA